MNTPKSVAWGWVVFTVAGVSGAMIGSQQWNDGRAQRRKGDVELKQRQQAQLEEISKKLEKKKLEKQASVASTPPGGVTGLASGQVVIPDGKPS